MATIRDMMPAFELYQPAGIDDVLTLLKRHGKDAWVMAGGMDSLDWFKDRVKRPKVVVDLSQVKGLKGIRTQANGAEIGALTTLTEVINHPLIQSRYGLLAPAHVLGIRMAVSRSPGFRIVIRVMSTDGPIKNSSASTKRSPFALRTTNLASKAIKAGAVSEGLTATQRSASYRQCSLFAAVGVSA